MGVYGDRVRPLILRFRRPIVVAAHIVLIPLSNYLAFWLRFDGEIPEKYFAVMVSMTPYLLILRSGVFLFYRLYQGLWRYTSIWDLWNIIGSTFISSVLFYATVRIGFGISFYPRSVFIIDTLLLILFLGGIRLPWRIHREFEKPRHRGTRKRVLIYGAGDAGEMIVRDMKQHPHYLYRPIGFVDDDPLKKGMRIHGVQVLGMQEDIRHILDARKVHEVVLAIPSASPGALRGILRALEPYHIPIKTLPNLQDILDGHVTVGQIRNLSLEDLLTRAPVDLDLSPVKRMLEGRRVLVTGAGGSIGSELCRQIAGLNPFELVILDRNENGLFAVDNELRSHQPLCMQHAVVADVSDAGRICEVLRRFRPEVVFHAAAHKHVPMMESNPCEAIKNNVTGTRVLAEAAAEAGVDKFVLISTDKAVNPTSVMGASKRLAEMIVHMYAHVTSTSFVAVRFGNVLASSGSVVPIFMEQIAQGGPVTVTHPLMKRYFMLIPEAVQLVLLAAALDGDGETYALDMGEPISVLDMARNMIRLAGFVPDTEIQIVFSGVRPGEKMEEELVGRDETAEPSDLPEILRIRGNRNHQPHAGEFLRKVMILEEASNLGNPDAVLSLLAVLVPGYGPSGEFESSFV